MRIELLSALHFLVIFVGGAVCGSFIDQKRATACVVTVVVVAFMAAILWNAMQGN